MGEAAEPGLGDAQAILSAYVGGVGVLGLACLLYVLARLQQRRSLITFRLRPWSIGWTDFLILVFLLLSWTVASSGILYSVMPPLEGESAGGEYEVWQAAFAGVLMHAGFLLLFMGYRVFLPFPERVPLSEEHVGLGQAGRMALLHLLAALPVMWFTMFLWTTLLTYLKDWGIEVPMDAQVIVGYFDSVESPWALLALLLLAVAVAPVTEELVFRAGVYRFLKARMRPTWAVLASSLLFGTIHQNLAAFPVLALLGCVLCFSYEASGSVRTPIILHALFNANTILLIFLQSHQS